MADRLEVAGFRLERDGWGGEVGRAGVSRISDAVASSGVDCDAPIESDLICSRGHSRDIS